MKLDWLPRCSLVVLLVRASTEWVTAEPSKSSAVPAGGGGADPSLNEWFHARCGPTGRSTWLYQGGLYDPLTGDQIAHVEGMEILEAVSMPTNHRGVEEDDNRLSLENDNQKNNPKNKRRRKPKKRGKTDKMDETSAVKASSSSSSTGMDLLSIHGSLTHPDSKYTQAGTLLSRKFFIYRSKDDKKTLLQSVKLRPYSPERKIPLNQVVSAYATANTFIERSPREWMVHGEWPDGRTVWNQATVHRNGESWSEGQATDESLSNQQGKSNQRRRTKRRRGKDTAQPPVESFTTKSLEFTVHVRPRAKNRNAKDKKGPDLTLEPATIQETVDGVNGTATKTTSATRSPPRSSWFSIGPSSSTKLSTGARETYHYEWTEDENPKQQQQEEEQYDRYDEDALRRMGARRRRRFLLGRPRKKATKVPSSATGSECSVRYTRYGEGPVWYGPNRFCLLELRGKRWPSNKPLPDHIQSWCRRHGWEASTSSGDDNDDTVTTGRELILGFRNNDLNLNKILGEDTENQQGWRQYLMGRKWLKPFQKEST